MAMHHELGNTATTFGSDERAKPAASRFEAERTFGFTMAVLLGILQGLWWTGWYAHLHLLAWLTQQAGGPTAVARAMWIIGSCMALAALVCPAILWPFHKAWMAFGEGMSWVMSRLILGVVYYGVVTPVAQLRRWFASDAMQRRFEPDQPSYWQSRPRQPFDPKRCAKQY